MGLKDQHRALRNLDLLALVADSVKRHEDAVLDKNREQMMAGKGANDQPFKPYYTDPHWGGNTAKAAGYSRYKDTLGLPTPSGIPNFYIEGKTHRELQITITGRTFTITSRVPWAGRINSWQNGNVFGLSEQSMSELWDSTVGPDVTNQFKKKLGI